VLDALRAEQTRESVPALEADLPAPVADPEREDGRRPVPSLPQAHLPRRFTEGSGWAADMAYEQIHALAAHVVARRGSHGMRVLAITSALAGEGKTTIALALAEKLASAGRRVLVMDLDVHRGTLSQVCNLDEQPGAVETAADRQGPFYAYPTIQAGLSVMPAGQYEHTEAGIPLFSPQLIQGLVVRALENHDVLILDCPPLSPVADTHIIGDIADASVLVVRASATPREVLERAIEDYGREKFFAAVLNCAQPDEIPYFREVYGYYRRRGGRNGRNGRGKKKRR